MRRVVEEKDRAALGRINRSPDGDVMRRYLEEELSEVLEELVQSKDEVLYRAQGRHQAIRGLLDTLQECGE